MPLTNGRSAYGRRLLVFPFFSSCLLQCLVVLAGLLATANNLQAQQVRRYKDSAVITTPAVTVVLYLQNGKADYRFTGGGLLKNTVAYVKALGEGDFYTTDYKQHRFTITLVNDGGGKGIRISWLHQDATQPVQLTQHITVYATQAYVLTDLEAMAAGKDKPVATREISPLCIVPAQQGFMQVAGSAPRVLDVPFDNDDWTGAVTRRWPQPGAAAVSGTSYELAAVYDHTTLAGMAVGSVQHDFWKTGIGYATGDTQGMLSTFNVYGGAATADNKQLPALYGGSDGTHDHAPHGIQKAAVVHSPLVYISGSNDVRKALTGFGAVNARLNGSLQWKGEAPFYWNSFGVEDVLGYRNIMQPDGVRRISDFLASMQHFNSHQPVLSIDSYDQNIYTTQVLRELGEYGAAHRQRMGFYFIPFAVWIWRDSLNRLLPGTGTPLKDVVLRDSAGQPIFYKEGDFGAYAIDPTHPVTRTMIIHSLQKAKAIHAAFIKIDFLTAGAMETPAHYDTTVTSGMQAFNRGMRMLKQLADSILGREVFITEAISPMFPSQYAHTRFISTDVYSHLRDDEPGFPHYGSTEASLANGSLLWWVQGSLWPYTNLDVSIMKNFQHNPDLSEQAIKVRLYAMMAMGSILGDGSDFRQPLAAERAQRFLNNPALCRFFSHPKAFTPLRLADGDSMDQQLAFYLKADTALLALFNFHQTQTYAPTISLQSIGLAKGNYRVQDFLTGATLGNIRNGETSFQLTVPVKDAYLVKLEPVHRTDK